MSDPDSTGAGSFAADHVAAERSPACVAPIEANGFNTIRIPLAPVACWRLADPAFDFDSSVILPSFASEVGDLADLVGADNNKGCPAAIFGHADPVGSDDVNKTISDRRAIAVYALLTRQPKMWEDLYANPVDGDTWGVRSIQRMLAALVHSGGVPFYLGPIDGNYGPETKDAVEHFQGENGLAVDGKAGPNTRGKLFPKYMDFVCTPFDPDADPASPPKPFQMQSSDFLGGGADGGKMAVQGCGRFNPVKLLPSSTMNGADQEARNAQDAPNRRVLLFLFRKGTKITAADWPCPRVKESGKACKAQFWPDGDQRRQNGDVLRSYAIKPDTMACRFYEGFARRSPCEGARAVSIRLLDDEYKPCSQVSFTLFLPNEGKRTGTTTKTGWLHVMLPALTTRVDVEYAPGTMGSHRVTVALDGGRTDDAYLAQIANLGFGKDAPDDAARIVAFQTATTKLEVTGELDDATRAALDSMQRGPVAPYFQETDG